MKYIKYTKPKEFTKHLSRLIRYFHPYHEKISEKTIRRSENSY